MAEACYKSAIEYLLEGHVLPVALQPVSAAPHRLLDEGRGLVLPSLVGEGSYHAQLIGPRCLAMLRTSGSPCAHSRTPTPPPTYQHRLLRACLSPSHILLNGDGSLILV